MSAEKLNGATRMAAKAADIIVRWRWFCVLIALALLSVSVVRIETIWPLDPSARVFFAPENPDRQALDRFEEVFSKDDNLMIVIEPAGGDVFAPQVLAAIGAITERDWLLPFVRRVDSLTNFQHSFTVGDELVVRDLVPAPEVVGPGEAAEARAIALSRVELVNAMVSPSADVTQVQVKFVLPAIDPATEVPSIVREAKAMVAAIEQQYPFLDLRLTGSVMINNQFSVSGQEDGQRLMAPMFLVILVIVGLALRSVFGTLSVLVVIVFSAVTGLGALGWLGLSLNSVTVLAPLYIMTLAVASAVHILASCRQTMLETGDRKEWVRRALTDHMSAITVACVTTAIGFFSLNFSISPPFRQLGTTVGFGVLAALVYTVLLLPALIIALPIRRHTTPAASSQAMDRVAQFVIANRSILLPGMPLFLIVSAAGMTQLKLEDDFLRYFDERYEFRRDTDFTEDRLTGVNSLEYALPSGAAQGINDPAYLAEIGAFAEWLRAQPEVTSVRTLTDTIARLNMNMHSDDPAYHRLPETRDEASQFLFLYELSLGYGMDLTDQIDVDRATIRLSVLMSRVTTAQMRELTRRAGGWLEANAPLIHAAWTAEHADLPRVTPTGVVHVFNLISFRDVRAMLAGTLLALLLISGVLVLALRDLRMGAVSVIPNLIPAFMAFGLWGYSIGAVTLAIAVVLAATLGIVVEDTVHFLSKYVRARKAGLTPEEAVRYTFRSVGMALFVTTMGLVGGFAVLAQSGFSVNGDMAKLTALTILLALLADFLLLPSLLIWLDTRRSKMSAKNAALASMLLALVLGAGIAAPLARAETPEERGLAISVEADRRDLGLGNYAVNGEMVLRDKAGRESRRSFENLILERADPGVGDLGIIVFSRPRDIRGTALLTHANIEPEDDDQWLYLPAVKRVKRISSSNRAGKFVSSEFSYEDLGSQEVADYSHRWLRDEPCPTDPALGCFVVETVPKNPKSGYSRRVGWIDAEHYRPQQIDFFNRRGDHEKTLTFTGYQQYLGKFWRADRMRMTNTQTGKETDLIWTDYRFNANLTVNDFDAQRLPQMAR